MRMSRRMGLLGGVKLPTMQELFGAATLVAESHDYTGSSTGTFSVSLTSVDTSTPFYCFYIAGSSFEVSKMQGTIKTQLVSIGTRAATLSSTAVTSGEAYGGVICLLRFAGFTTAITDRLLRALAINDVTWRVTNSSTYIRANASSLTMTDAAVQVVYALQESYQPRFCFSISSGDELPNLTVSSPPLFSVNDNIIHLLYEAENTRYAVSWDGTSQVVVPVGGIYELTLA